MSITNNINQDLSHKIREDFSGFNDEELLNYTKLITSNIHFNLSTGRKEQLKKYCTDEVIKKILENKEIYRITPDIDTARVEYARIDDYKNENNEIYITVYASVFFYDNISNNKIIDEERNYDKYWNDIWSITFKGDFGKDTMIKCPFCSNQLQYDYEKNMYTCEECKDSIYYSKINWKIIDIEVNKFI